MATTLTQIRATRAPICAYISGLLLNVKQWQTQPKLNPSRAELEKILQEFLEETQKLQNCDKIVMASIMVESAVEEEAEEAGEYLFQAIEAQCRLEILIK